MPNLNLINSQTIIAEFKFNSFNIFIVQFLI
jgi:hypothetical protein